jgi:hypothetical protein
VRADRSRYHCPGWLSSSNAFSTYSGKLEELPPPTRLIVRPPLTSGGNLTRFVELSQQGWAIVIVVPSMAATGQRGSVHAPMLLALVSDQSVLPPV